MYKSITYSSLSLAHILSYRISLNSSISLTSWTLSSSGLFRFFDSLNFFLALLPLTYAWKVITHDFSFLYQLCCLYTLQAVCICNAASVLARRTWASRCAVTILQKDCICTMAFFNLRNFLLSRQARNHFCMVVMLVIICWCSSMSSLIFSDSLRKTLVVPSW